MIGIQMERNYPVANRIFLTGPASEVRLGQFHRWQARLCRNHRDQFWRGGNRWCGQSLPPFFPETLLVRGEVSLPILDIGCLTSSFSNIQLAPVTDQSDLDH